VVDAAELDQGLGPAVEPGQADLEALLAMSALPLAATGAA
jgi:hypothetical protein